MLSDKAARDTSSKLIFLTPPLSLKYLLVLLCPQWTAYVYIIGGHL